jgi:hypothetical protein
MGAMTGEEQRREEGHFRKVEGAMLYIEDAARRLDETAQELKKDGAPAYLIAALETAAGAARADHARLMKSVYWRPPSSDQGELLAAGDEQQRLAS